MFFYSLCSVSSASISLEYLMLQKRNTANQAHGEFKKSHSTDLSAIILMIWWVAACFHPIFIWFTLYVCVFCIIFILILYNLCLYRIDIIKDYIWNIYSPCSFLCALPGFWLLFPLFVVNEGSHTLCCLRCQFKKHTKS